MKLDLQIQCRLSFDGELKQQAPEVAVDTSDLPSMSEITEEGVPVSAWEGPDDDPTVEHAQLMTAPDEYLIPDQLLIVARGVSIELNVSELEAAIAALKAVAGVPR